MLDRLKKVKVDRHEVTRNTPIVFFRRHGIFIPSYNRQYANYTAHMESKSITELQQQKALFSVR